MALQTLAEAANYSNDMLLRGVIEEIIEEEPLFSLLPYLDVVGRTFAYNRETTIPAGVFFNPGDTWTEATPTVTRVSTDLKIAGKDADVDNFLAATRRDVNDVEAEVIGKTVKGVARTVKNEWIYGDVDNNAKGFDGLHAIIGPDEAAQEVQAGSGTAGGPGTFEKLHQTIDLVKAPGTKILMMSRRSRRQISTLSRSQGWELATAPGLGSIGMPINMFAGLPIFINDFITDTEDVVDGGFGGRTGDDATSIFCIALGEESVHGLQNGTLEVVRIGDLENKDATRNRVKWYNSIACLSTLGVARLSGVDTQPWTNA